MNKERWGASSAGLLAGGLILIGGAAAAAIVVAPKVSYVRGAVAGIETAPAKHAVQHLPTPPFVKAVYMTQCAVGTPTLRDSLVKLIDDTELNAVVIDVRDYTGTIAFPTDSPMLREFVSDECGAADMKAFIQKLHDKNIYVIGRITVFQNPAYAKAHPEQAVQKIGGGVWHDYKGLAFIDVGARPYWETVVELSKVSYDIGFDELNYDYLRFPSDGPMKEADYSWSKGKSKAEVLEEFYKYLHDGLKSDPSTNSGQAGPVLSADLFGYVTVHTDDLGIGQILERAFPYFDYIDPMVYPSHYNKGFAGLADVNSDPYKVVNVSLEGAVARALATTTSEASFAFARIGTSTPALYAKPVYPASVIRPWLQSFDYPVSYTPQMVAAQMRATADAGLTSYLFWDAANKYRSLREVLSTR